MLTIGQLAAYAGVTVRAVRHYHQVGLLPEPARDHSGYRTYVAQDVVRLIKIRTLADAGVPLARIPELLDADPEEFADAIKQVDKHLRSEIRRYQKYRKDVAKLAAGDSLALPTEVIEYLDLMRSHGVAEALLDIERDAWIVLAARFPDEMPAMMVEKRRQFGDPRVAKLYSMLDPEDLSPDDPRLVEIADLLIEVVEEDEARGDLERQAELEDPTMTMVLDSFADKFGPITERLQELMNERGWSGWTQMERTDYQ